MSTGYSTFRRACAGLALSALLLLASACDDDPTRPPGSDPREYGVVLNSVGLSLTVFPVDAPDSSYTIPLGPSGTPGNFAVRGGIALVPLGLLSAVAVVDLVERTVLRTIPLPAGGGATGVAIVDDSLAFVGNPLLNSVTPVRYAAGTTESAIPVGVYPQALVASGDRVFVIEANLEDFMPAGPSGISVIDATTLEVDADFPLSGQNAGHALLDGSTLYVLNTGDGNPDAANASLSEIALPGAFESDHFEGFGIYATRIALLSGDRIAVGSPVDGVSIFDVASEGFVVGPTEGIRPESASNTLAVGADDAGTLYIVDAKDCTAPGEVFRMTAALTVDETIDVGSCPVDIVFTTF